MWDNTQMDRTDILLAIYIQVWLICRGYFDSWHTLAWLFWHHGIWKRSPLHCITKNNSECTDAWTVPQEEGKLTIVLVKLYPWIACTCRTQGKYCYFLFGRIVPSVEQYFRSIGELTWSKDGKHLIMFTQFNIYYCK